MRCDICIDPPKDGSCEGCNCETCASADRCHRSIRPTIRITKKCTQACAHCCYTCSPNSEEMMSLETAETVAAFLKANNIKSINLMGGEVWLNPEWKAIIRLFSVVDRIRIVSNADFMKFCPEFLPFLAEFDNVKLCLSHDKWHTNKYVKKAEKAANRLKIRCDVSGQNGDSLKDDGIVPVGRMRFGAGNAFDMFLAYCQKPENKYSILIDENGGIYKCCFERFWFDNVKNFTETNSFNPRFKEFGKAFHGIFISNCLSCDRFHRQYEEM